jgi:two-component sensor histidine kinase
MIRRNIATIVVIALAAFALLLTGASYLFFEAFSLGTLEEYFNENGMWFIFARWQDIVSEGGILVLSGIWIVIAIGIAPYRRVRRLLVVGYGLMFIGSLTDLLGEFFPGWESFDVLENLGILSGMITATFGLFGWVETLRESNEELEEQVAERTRDLDEALEYKSVLLRELQHRVRNNLQVVSGMLKLQSLGTANSEARNELEVARERIVALGKVHDKLMESENASKVRSRDLFDHLSHAILAALGSEGLALDVHTDFQDLDIPADDAVLWGIILNELIAGALVHGMSARKSGSLEIGFGESGDSMVLSVRDNGDGNIDRLPDSRRLLDGLLGQLQATISLFDLHPGLRVEVRKRRS